MSKVLFKVWLTVCCLVFARCVFADSGLDPGEQLARQGQYEQAIAWYRSLPAEEDTRGVVSAHIAAAYLKLGKADDAEKWMDQAIEKDPKNASFHDRRAGVYSQQTRDTDAGMFHKLGLAHKMKKDLKRAVQLAPKNVDYIGDLMQFYLGAPGIAGGSNRQARKLARRIQALDEKRGYIARAQVETVDDEPEKAENILTTGLHKYPADYQLNIQLIFSYFQRKAYATTYQAILQWREHAPDDPRTDYRLGWLAALSGQHLEEGEAAMRRYLAVENIEPGWPERVWAHYRLGLILQHRDDLPGARAELEQAAASKLDLPGLQDALSAIGK